MAARDSEDSGYRKKKEELDDITTCCICYEFFTDPKALPCIHTFCMKCIQETGLKTNKGPGDVMPCPICRRLFKIPTEGFRGLPKNFFMEKLTEIQLANISGQPMFSMLLCDACHEDHENEAGEEIPVATTFCVDCRQKLCSECYRNHRKTKFTKRHQLIPIDEHEGYLSMTANLPPSVCVLHENKSLDVYCADCKEVVCAVCFFEGHKTHEGSHVNNCVDNFKKEIQSNTDAINECISQVQMKMSKFMHVKEEIQQQMDSLEGDVERRRGEVKKFADNHASRLLQVLCSGRQRRLKEIQTATDDIDAYLLHVETYKSYSQKIMANGSATDICRAFSQLSTRASELLQQCQPITEEKIKEFKIYFRESELEEFLEEDSGNLIGGIEEDDKKPEKTSKQTLLAEHAKEIESLGKQIDIERKEKDELKSEYEQHIDSLTEELRRERTNNDAHIKKLEQQLDNNQIIRNTLQDKYEELDQELEAQRQDNASFPSIIDKLEHDLYTQKNDNTSLQCEIDKLKQELGTHKNDNISLHARLVQEVSAHKAAIVAFEQNAEKLKQDPEATHADRSMTNDEIKDRIRKIYAQFVSDVDPYLLGDYLKQESVITIDQWKSITEHKFTAKEKCREVLDFLLSSNHPKAFLVVRGALKKVNHHILSIINNEDRTLLPEQTVELPNQQPQSLPNLNPQHPLYHSSPSIP